MVFVPTCCYLPLFLIVDLYYIPVSSRKKLRLRLLQDTQLVNRDTRTETIIIWFEFKFQNNLYTYYSMTCILMNQRDSPLHIYFVIQLWETWFASPFTCRRDASAFDLRSRCFGDQWLDKVRCFSLLHSDSFVSDFSIILAKTVTFKSHYCPASTLFFCRLVPSKCFV